MLMNACRLGLGRGMEFDDWVLPFQFSASYTDADGVLDQDTPLAELGPGPFVDVKTYGRGNDRARATRRARESRTTYVATPARETFCHTASFQFSTRGNYGNDENSAIVIDNSDSDSIPSPPNNAAPKPADDASAVWSFLATIDSSENAALWDEAVIIFGIDTAGHIIQTPRAYVAPTSRAGLTKCTTRIRPYVPST